MSARVDPPDRAATLTVKVTPRARQEKVVTTLQVDGRTLYRVYVHTPPEDGKANAAVIALLAKELGLAKSCFSILKGDTSREKVIKISQG